MKNTRLLILQNSSKSLRTNTICVIVCKLCVICV
nr:MAG TPA_asm: hypothetical protein [Caudoviricetes sp.]